MPQDLYVILGATGALGSRVATLLCARGGRLLLVGRCDQKLQRIAEATKGAHTLRLDVTRHDASALLAVISRLAPARVVLVDAVLDKASSRRMLASVMGATKLVRQVSSEMARQSAQLFLVCASSIAAHAQWPYVTTYAMAKRQQMVSYQQLETPAAIVYLPVLYGHSTVPSRIDDRLLTRYFEFNVSACSIDVAATLLVVTSTGCFLETSSKSATICMSVITFEHSLRVIHGLSRPGLQRWVSALVAPAVILMGYGVFRDDPAWQRRASYACRYLTPTRVRRHRDHHLWPQLGTAEPGVLRWKGEGIRIYEGESWTADVREAEKASDAIRTNQKS